MAAGLYLRSGTLRSTSIFVPYSVQSIEPMPLAQSIEVARLPSYYARVDTLTEQGIPVGQQRRSPLRRTSLPMFQVQIIYLSTAF